MEYVDLKLVLHGLRLNHEVMALSSLKPKESVLTHREGLE